jgi:hypothetical protein
VAETSFFGRLDQPSLQDGCLYTRGSIGGTDVRRASGLFEGQTSGWSLELRVYDVCAGAQVVEVGPFDHEPEGLVLWIDARLNDGQLETDVAGDGREVRLIADLVADNMQGEPRQVDVHVEAVITATEKESRDSSRSTSLLDGRRVTYTLTTVRYSATTSASVIVDGVNYTPNLNDDGILTQSSTSYRMGPVLPRP